MLESTLRALRGLGNYEQSDIHTSSTCLKVKKKNVRNPCTLRLAVHIKEID